MAACDTSSAAHALVMSDSGGSGFGTLALPVMQVTTCLPYGLSAFFCCGTLRTPLGPFLFLDMIDSCGGRVAAATRPISDPRPRAAFGRPLKQPACQGRRRGAGQGGGGS